MGNQSDVDVLPIAEPPPITVTGEKEQIQRQDTSATTKLSRWWHNEQNWDELERRLYPKAKEDPSLKDFLDDYAEIKRKQGRKLFDHLVRYTILDRSSADRPRFEWHPLNDEEPFSSGLQSLRAALTAGSPNSLRFWYVLRASDPKLQ